MGMLGDIIYPDNREMAEDLNKKYQQLLDNNALQNNLVNSYHALASSITKFDAYLMSLLCMQYAIVYDEEKLANLPETNIPKITQSTADRIEIYALGGVGVLITLKTLKAMGNGVVNLYRNASVYKTQITQGYEAFKENMQNLLDRTRLKIYSGRSGNVAALTEENAAGLTELSEELIDLSSINPLSEAEVEELNASEINEIDAGFADVFEVLDEEVIEAVDTVVAGSEISEEAATASMLGRASAFAEGAAAVLGPVMVVIIVATEIIGLVEAGEMNDKLKEAEKNIDSLIEKQNASIDNLKKAFNNLLASAIADIKEYNNLIKDELNLSPSKKNFFISFPGYTPGDGFSYKGLNRYQTNLEKIKDLTSINILQDSADSDLQDVTACIRAQATQDAIDTKIIVNMKPWLKRHNLEDINDHYIEEAMDMFGVNKDRVDYCNQLRKFMNVAAQRLLPYHQAIAQLPQHPGVKTRQPQKSPFNNNVQPNPNYHPDPKDFSLKLFSRSPSKTKSDGLKNKITHQTNESDIDTSKNRKIRPLKNDVGTQVESSSVSISNQYIWLEKEYSLPLEFSCNFVCNAQSDEFLPCFSKTKAQWGNRDCDALSWYMSPHRHDITFRTQLFRGWPAVKRNGSGFNAEVGKQYKMTCQIRNNTATYWIDGQEYATTTYDPDTIPPSGYIGFAVYGKADIQVTDISTTVL